MPLLDDEGKDWDETEKELDTALCEFCNNASDPIDDIELWNNSIKRDFKTLCEAYNNWYSWRKDKSEQSRTD